MQHFDYFPSRVYRDERPDFVHQVLPTCDQHLNQVRNDNFLFSQTNHLGRETNLRQLSDYLLLSAGNILREQGYVVEKYDFYVSALCAQEIRKNGRTKHHSYKNSQICGWFFVEVPEALGASVVYHDTRINKNMIELEYNHQQDVLFATTSIHFNNIKVGTVLFNNSWMNSQLIGGDSELPTKCIHFTISHRDIIHNIY